MDVNIYDYRVWRSKVIKCPHVHYSIGLLQSVYRPRKKLTRRGLAFWLLQQNGQISLCIQHKMHHKEHMNMWPEWGSRWVPVPLFLFTEHVDRLKITCRPASAPPFPFPVHVGTEDHVHACSATISLSGTRGCMQYYQFYFLYIKGTSQATGR